MSVWVSFDDVIHAYEAQAEPEWDRYDPPGVAVPVETERVRKLKHEVRHVDLSADERRDYMSGRWLR